MQTLKNKGFCPKCAGSLLPTEAGRPLLMHAGRDKVESTRLLIIGDDVVDGDAPPYLENYNIRVLSTCNHGEALRQFVRQEPSLVILDLWPGKESGLDLLRNIRARSAVPVILTSSYDRDEFDPADGLDLGADDYLTKPFSLRELVAHIKAVSRPGTQRQQLKRRVGYRFERWQLDCETRALTGSAGVRVALTKREYGLLIALLDAPGEPLSRERLIQVTRMHEDILDRSINVQVLRLRNKLEKDPHSPQIIRTLRSIGYMFMLPVEALYG